MAEQQFLGDSEDLSVSVIVPMRNEARHITACLRSLLAQSYQYYEVIVVDGMSEDGSPEVVAKLAEEHTRIRLLTNPHRLTSFALNLGLSVARGDVIIILGSHASVLPDFIAQNIATLLRTGADCVGGPIQSIAEGLVPKAISLAMSSPFGVGNALFRYSQKEGYVDTVAFGAYRREVFDRIGLFDERLGRNQDDEFNYRLRKLGGRILLDPRIKSSYYTRSSLPKLWQQYFQYGLWKVPVLAKHPEMTMLRQLVPFTFVSSLIVSGLLGLFNHLFAYLFLGIALSYVSVMLMFSFKIAAREGWRYLPVLPLAFACLHLSYGLGFGASLIRFRNDWFALLRRMIRAEPGSPGCRQEGDVA